MYKDEHQHRLHNPFLKARSQAWFRKEDWQLTIEDWFQIWANEDDWNNRGRASHNICLTRIDPNLPWTMDNVALVTRKEQITANLMRRNFNRGMKYKKRQTSGNE
jgi:hypothetical protein